MTGTPTFTDCSANSQLKGSAYENNGHYYQYFASGGSEFVVQFDGEYVESGSASRTYSATFSQVPCELNGGSHHYVPTKDGSIHVEDKAHCPCNAHTVGDTFTWTQSVSGFSYVKITNAKVWQLSEAKLDGTRELLDTNAVTAEGGKEMFKLLKGTSGRPCVATFYKVASKCFLEDLSKCTIPPKFNVEDLEKIYEDIKRPTRATEDSAGYDFYTPFDIELQPGESVQFPTGIRALIDTGWWLMLLPKSGLGCDYHVELWNTVAAIDGDYYHTKNEGDIILKLRVDSDVPLSLHRGDKIIQGIFVPYGVTYDDDVCKKRTGGFGSTGR